MITFAVPGPMVSSLQHVGNQQAKTRSRFLAAAGRPAMPNYARHSKEFPVTEPSRLIKLFIFTFQHLFSSAAIFHLISSDKSNLSGLYLPCARQPFCSGL